MIKPKGLFDSKSKLADLQKYPYPPNQDLGENTPKSSIRVRILSNFSTQYFVHSLGAALHYRGISSEVVDPGFDQWEIILNNVENLEKVDYTVLFLSSMRLILNPEASEPSQFTEYVVKLCESYRQSVGGELIVVLPESLREGIDTSLIFHTWLNSLRRAFLDGFPADTLFYDLDVLVREFGHSNWFDTRFFEIGKFPWHPNCNLAIGSAIADLIWSAQKRPCKLIVLDLDNTLWRGEVGEIGYEGIGLDQNEDGFSFLLLQRMILDLKNNGVLLAISSKNSYQNVREVFDKRREMILKITDFVAIEVNWNPKYKAVAKILEKLNLTDQGVVFIDDSTSERAEIREYFPNLIVPDLPDEHTEWTYYLASSKIFSLGKIKQEDLARNEMYFSEEKRVELSKTTQSYSEFLQKLKLEVTLEKLTSMTLDRAHELVMKTNQFNLTGLIFSRLELNNMIFSSKHKVLVFRLRDKFGDYGIISVLVLGRLKEDNWEICNWVMSCRALGRKIEHQIIQLAQNELIGDGGVIYGKFVPTGRNEVVSELLVNLGFTNSGGDGRLGLKIP